MTVQTKRNDCPNVLAVRTKFNDSRNKSKQLLEQKQIKQNCATTKWHFKKITVGVK